MNFNRNSYYCKTLKYGVNIFWRFVCVDILVDFYFWQIFNFRKKQSAASGVGHCVLCMAVLNSNFASKYP